MCEMTDVLEQADHNECSICGHEWPLDTAADADSPAVDRVVKDAYGNVLADGDVVAMIKDLKLKGSSDVLKTGTKSKPIRLVDGGSRNLLQNEWHHHRPEGVFCEESSRLGARPA